MSRMPARRPRHTAGLVAPLALCAALALPVAPAAADTDERQDIGNAVVAVSDAPQATILVLGEAASMVRRPRAHASRRGVIRKPARERARRRH